MHHVMNFTDVDDRTIAESQQRRRAAARLHRAVRRRLPRGRRGARPRTARGDAARDRRRRTSRRWGRRSPRSRPTATPTAATARSTSRSRRCPTTASWPGSITAACSRGARVDSDKYEKDDARDFVLWKATKPGEPTWDPGIGAGSSGLAHRVLGDGAAPARRAADRSARRRRRPDLPASRERDCAGGRGDRAAVLALLAPRRAPDDRGGRQVEREDVEVARQRLQPRGHRAHAGSGRRRCAISTWAFTIASS